MKGRHRRPLWLRWLRRSDDSQRIALTFYGPKITNWSDHSLYWKFWGFIGGLVLLSAVITMFAAIGIITTIEWMIR